MSRNRLLLVQEGTAVEEWDLGCTRVRVARFTPDLSALVFFLSGPECESAGGCPLGLFDLRSGESRWISDPKESCLDPLCLTMVPDGSEVLVSGIDDKRGTFFFRPLQGDPFAVTFEDFPRHYATCASFRADGTQFFIGSEEEIEQWDYPRRRSASWPLLLPEWADVDEGVGGFCEGIPRGRCEVMALSPEGDRLFWCYGIRIWDKRDPLLPALYQRGSALLDVMGDPAPRRADFVPPATAACFLGDRNHLLTGHNGGSVRLWDLRGGTMLDSFPCGSYVTTLAPTGEPGDFLVGCLDGSAHLWSPDRARSRWVFRGHGSPVLDVAYDAQTGTVLSAAEGGTVFRWNAP